MRMKPLFAVCVLAMVASPLLRASDWPTRIVFDDGTELGVKGDFQYDWVRFGDDRLPYGGHLFDATEDWRRQEVNVYLKKKDAYELNLGYDFASREWVDNYIAFETAAGKFQFGEFRTPVGWEDGTTSGSATTFIEAGLPNAVVYEGRRAGVGWTYAASKHWTLQAQWFGSHDLNHEAKGNTTAARLVYAPIVDPDQVVHLGISASREQRNGHATQFSATPETALTSTSLVDSGTLSGVKHIDREGFEGAWMRGPMLLQGEYLGLHATREGRSAFDSHGWYLSASWMLTGESRSYKDTAFGDPTPTHRWGAIGVGLRYSRVDLTDDNIFGGIEHDWTVGVNWYISKHLKVQANEVFAHVDRGTLPASPHVFELRAQVAF